MAVQIKSLVSSNNSQAIKNILDKSDDTYWMSNGSRCPVVSIEFDGHAEHISLDFQRGFQPRVIKAVVKAPSGTHESMIEVSKLDSKIKIPIPDACTAGTHQVDIVFEESHDPYGRICIYSLAIQ